MEFKSTPGKLSAADVSHFFGKKEGQTNTDLVKEIRELSEQDRIDLSTGFSDGTLTY